MLESLTTTISLAESLMTTIPLARQPILDHDKSVVGYELVYPQGAMGRASSDSEVLASARVAFDAINEIGVEQLVGASRAWINITPELLELDLVSSLPPERVVLELDASSFAAECNCARLTELSADGYTLALNRFRYAPELTSLLEVVNIVKLDFAALGGRELAHQSFLLAPYGHQLVAEGLMTYDDFELATAAGVDLFQGYFFCRPQLLGGRTVPPSRFAMMRLATALQDPAIELAELDRLISGDVALSYRLLTFINSAYFSLRGQVSSIQHAVALLGIEPLRRWATVAVFSELGEKPRELFVTALIRAQFCEHAGRAPDGSPAELFTLGLFSVLDALNDTSMYTAVKDLPLTKPMHDALVHHTGAGRLLDCLNAIENGEFERAQAIVDNASAIYLDAIAWSNESAKQLIG
ncbi:MAG: EAL and HDOD domain-containing protein [Solirubrobacteraceae bacterium]